MAYTDENRYDSESGPEYIQPEQDIPEIEKTEEWFLKNARYYSTYYNQTRGSYELLDADGHFDQNGGEGDSFNEHLSPIERGWRNYLYILGKQLNIDYNYTTQDYTGNTLQAVWVKGKKIAQLVNHLLGNLLNQLDNKEITATSLSERVDNRRMEIKEDLMLQQDSQALAVLSQLEAGGLSFRPEGDMTFSSKEDVERYVKYTWRDNSEITAIDIAKDIEMDNHVDDMYVECFKDYSAANYTAVHNFVENGEVKQEKIPFYELIYDCHEDDPHNRKGRFWGKVKQYTPSELFLKYPDLDDDQRDEITRIAANDTLANEYATTYNSPQISWWNCGEGGLTVAAVTIYFRNMRDLRYKASEDKYGNLHYEKVRNDNKNGDYWTDDIYQVTLIANKYMVDWGPMKNVIRKNRKLADPESPIKVLTGTTFLGDGLPLVEMISQYQDKMDYYEYKITQMTGKDFGKTYWINGEKLGEGVDARELIQDLKTMSVHVGETSGEPGENENKKAVEMIDMTLDPNVVQYIRLYQEQERIVNEIMSIPKIAQGQQDTYIGLGTQKGTIAQSTLGLAKMYNDFKKFNENNLRYATDLAKLVYTEPGNEKGALVVGDRGIRWLKITKEERYEDMLVFIKTKDILDEQDKQNLLAIAQAEAQNQNITILDYMKIQKASNSAELYRDLEYSIEKKQRQDAMIAQQNAAAMKASEDVAARNAERIKMLEEGSATERVQISSNSKMATEAMKIDAKQKENVTADLPIRKTPQEVGALPPQQ